MTRRATGYDTSKGGRPGDTDIYLAADEEWIAEEPSERTGPRRKPRAAAPGEIEPQREPEYRQLAQRPRPGGTLVGVDSPDDVET